MSTPTTTLSFNSAGRTLFSPQEVRHLMRVEFDRAKRYGYAVSCLMIGIDRLESLHSIHGSDCLELIQGRVLDLVRKETRTSDYLGCQLDEHIVALFPHTPRRDGAALCERLLAGTRKMCVQAGETPLRISLSIGLAQNGGDNEISFETLLRVAEEGLAVADAGGGDRFVETELYQLYERQVKRATPSRRGRDVDAVEQRLGELTQESGSMEEAAVTLAEEIVSRALRRLESERSANELESLLESERRHRMELEQNLQEQERRLGTKMRGELERSRERESELETREQKYQREIDLLQRRISKLTHSLGATEVELKRVATMKSLDSGVSSIYRQVQGLSAGDDHFEMKKGLMTSIFEANIALQTRRGA